MKKPFVKVGSSNEATEVCVRWLGCGVDILKRPGSISLIQFGRVGKGKVLFLALIPKNPKPYPTFVFSWSWKRKICIADRILLGTTKKPVNSRSRSEAGKRIRFRRDRTLSGT